MPMNHDDKADLICRQGSCLGLDVKFRGLRYQLEAWLGFTSHKPRILTPGFCLLPQIR